LYVSKPAFPKVLAQGLGATYRLLLNKYYVDELYSAVIVRPLHWFSDRVLWQVFDVEIVDGAVNGAAVGVGVGPGAMALPAQAAMIRPTRVTGSETARISKNRWL